MSQQQSQPHNNTNNTSIAGKQRNNGKGKFLTRSHAMHECTSPPQTPTPRTSNSCQSSLPLINEQIKNDSTSTNNNNNSNKMSSVSPITVNTSHSNNNNNLQTNAQQTSTTTPTLFATNGNLNATQLDLEFPKLTPPKSKSPRNHNNNSNSANNMDHSNNCNQSNDTMSGNETITLNGSEISSSPILPTTAVTSSSSQNGSASNNDCSISLPSSQFASWSKQQQQHSANESDANNITSSSSCLAATTTTTSTNPNKNHSEKPNDNSNGSNGNVVSCTILLNDVEKKCNLLLAGGNSSQPNCIDGQFTDNNKDNKSNTDECSNSVEFSYKKNRNSAVSKMGGGGGCKPRQQKHNNQSANSNNHSNNNNNNNSNNIVGGGDADAMHNASNGCQSDYLSVESSTEHFIDQSGVDLLQFFKITLNKNAKDRYMLLRVEKELTALAQDQSRDMIKFPTMSSYNRMLIHRVAAWFGMEHNVDSTVQCVIVNTTKSTRLPEIRFKSLLTDTFSDEAPSRKSILKRDSHSFEEYRQGLLACPDRGNMLDRKAKSFEEREQEYEKAKRRIFKDEKNGEIELYWDNISRSSGGNKEHMIRMNKMSGSGDNNQSCHKDNNDDDTNDTHKLPRFADLPNWMKNQNNNRLLRVHSSSNDQRMDSRPSVEKSHSFGGYGPQSQHRLARGDSIGSAKGTNYSKHDSCSSQPTWRLSSLSSGYKTQSQSLRPGSMTPSPSYSSENHTPEPIQSVSSSGIVWAVTDMSSVPKGSVLIDPQTLKPIVNQDGSIYHFDPSNLPPGKLQTANASPAASPLPVDNANTQNRKRNQINVTEEHPTTDDKENENSTSENSRCRSIEIETTPEPEMTMPEPTKTISMNSLLSPLSKVYSEIKDNNLNRIVSDNCQETVMHPTVKNQSTSPHIPNDSEAFQLTAAITGEQSTNAKVDRDTTSNPTTIESKETSVTPNQTVNDKLQITTSSAVGSHAAAVTSAAAAKKEEIKILPAVVPVLGYTTTAAPNLYSPIETGVQLFTGAQPTQSTAFPTTYQQGLDGSIYAIPQPMIYGYPTVENDYHGGIFLPFYDQSNTQLPVNAQPTDQNPNTSDNRRNGGVPLAFYEPQTHSAMAVVPVAYPTTTTTTASPYGPAHNLYQGQIVYTSDQYNPATATNSQIPQFINYPISYTYPYNGTAFPYWGQAMTSSGIDPHQHLAQIRRTSTVGADNSTITTQTIDHHGQHILNNVQSSSHLIHQTKNHQSLLSTPNDNNTKQISNNNIDDMESKDNSNHSNATTAYERKKNPQNPNRKPFLGNSYRANNNNNNNNTNVHHNINASTNNQTTIHSSSSALHAGIRKAMNRLEDDITKRIDDGNKKAETDGNKKIGLQRHQSMVTESGGNNHMYSSGAGHHHLDTNSTPPTYDRANSSHNSDKRKISHNKPLIATLPIMSHFDRPRAPRPKPLDLRRSVSNRNTPSTNSTESNNSPNSIVSNDQPNTPNHSQLQLQQHNPIQTSPSYASHTLTSPMVNQSGMQQNLGARVVRMYHGDLVQNTNDSLASASSALCGEPFAYNPHSGMYIKLGKTYITHSMAFSNKAQQSDVRQSLPPITGIYPTMNMMLGYPAARQVGPRPSHFNQNYHKNNRAPR